MNHICPKCVMPAKSANKACKQCATFKPNRPDRLKLEKDFRKVFESFRGENKEYDCIVPLTGGKDSSFVLYYMSRVMGAKVLALTWNNGLLREQSWKNIENALKITGAGHKIVKFNEESLRKLEQAMFKSSGGYVCALCTFLLGVVMLSAAAEEKIPLVVSGFSYIQREMNSSFAVPKQATRKKMFEYYYKTFSKLFSTMLNRYNDPETSRKINEDITGLMGGFVKGSNKPEIYPVAVPLSNYVEWRPEKMAEVLGESFNWKSGRDGYEHTSCVIEPVRGYIEARQNLLQLRKEISLSVRLGELTREQGLEEAAKLSLDGKTPDKGIPEFLDFTGVTREEFDRCTSSKLSLRNKLFWVMNVRKLLKSVKWLIGI